LTALLVAGGFPGSTRAAGPVHGGAFLDGYGQVHPFGGLSLDTSNAPSWPNWDIARALTLREDGRGGWELDGFGHIHAFGSAPPIATPGYWPGWDIARDIVVTSRSGGVLDGASGYLLDGFGGIHAWGGAPALGGAPYTPGWDNARGLSIHVDGAGRPDGGWMLESNGSIASFGAAGALGLTLPRDDVHLKLHVLGNGTSGLAVSHWGVTTGFGSISPYWNGYTDWNAWSITRDIQLLDPTNPTPQPQPSSPAALASYRATLQPHGGAFLDGFGGVHPINGMFPLDTGNAPYWPNWDIARSLSVRTDASGGWVLDGFGGIHAFGAAPPVATPGYWANWDIARDIVVTSRDGRGIADGRQGYLLDGFGNLHGWGGAPTLSFSGALWPGFDIARGLEIHDDASGNPDGAWILDVFGTVHSVGNAPNLGTLSPVTKLPLWRHLHAVGSGFLLVGRNGVTDAAGNTGQPFWNNYSDWGGWDINRDVVVVNPSNPFVQAQPRSGGADQAFRSALTANYQNSVPLYRQLRALDCESAALQMAMASHGTYVSQDWILAVMGADWRGAVKDRYGNILRWGNPYQTFVGNVDGSQPLGTGYGVYAPPIIGAAVRAGRPALGGEGWSASDIYAVVAAGYPAAVWVPFDFAGATTRTWTAWDGSPIRYIRNEHTVTLVGVDYGQGTVTINDPEYGVKTMSMSFFQGQWGYLNNMAVAVA